MHPLTKLTLITAAFTLCACTDSNTMWDGLDYSQKTDAGGTCGDNINNCPVGGNAGIGGGHGGHK
jgi:hypothetical protein